MRTILITSATAGEGKSTISSNFVVALSQMNKKVLLVDADMRRPSQHKTFTSAQLASIPPQLLSDTINESRTNVPVEISSSELRKPGLSELLVKMTDEDPYEALHSVIKKTEIENLDLITSGTIPPNPVELLNSEVMSKFLEIAQEEYDYVVVDSPPIHAVADPIILSTMVDTTILVFNIVKTGRFDIIGGAEILSETAPKNVALLCNMTNPQHGGYYGYGRYSYNKYGFYGGYGFYGHYRYGGNYYHYYSSEDDDDDDSNGKKRK
jgi:capsular exopolysaccharide synthesis family protein